MLWSIDGGSESLLVLLTIYLLALLSPSWIFVNVVAFFISCVIIYGHTHIVPNTPKKHLPFIVRIIPKCHLFVWTGIKPKVLSSNLSDCLTIFNARKIFFWKTDIPHNLIRHTTDVFYTRTLLYSFDKDQLKITKCTCIISTVISRLNVTIFFYFFKRVISEFYDFLLIFIFFKSMVIALPTE